MGFGLHLGYGIEGPVGSIFKMEASYLSPNVNIAARLETATKQFGVSILISGKLYNLFIQRNLNQFSYMLIVLLLKVVLNQLIYIQLILIMMFLLKKEKKLEFLKVQKKKRKFLKEKKY